MYVHLPLQPITTEGCLHISDLLELAKTSADTFKHHFDTMLYGISSNLSSSAIFWAATDLFTFMFFFINLLKSFLSY